MHRTSLAAAGIAAFAFVACRSAGTSMPSARTSDANAAHERAHEEAISTRPQTPESRVGAPQQQSADARGDVQGRIASVDPQEKEIAVDTGGATTQVKLADDAQITVNGQRASFSDLRPGADVHASLDRSGDMPRATRVEVRSKQK